MWSFRFCTFAVVRKLPRFLDSRVKCSSNFTSMFDLHTWTNGLILYTGPVYWTYQLNIYKNLFCWKWCVYICILFLRLIEVGSSFRRNGGDTKFKTLLKISLQEKSTLKDIIDFLIVHGKYLECLDPNKQETENHPKSDVKWFAKSGKS